MGGGHAGGGAGAGELPALALDVGSPSKEAERKVKGGEAYTSDGTVDLWGRPARRSISGGWRACWFIFGECSLFPRSI